MRTLFIDYETAWSDDYSLTKMTRTEYLYDERFKAHGMAASFDGYPDEWIPGWYLAEFWGDMASLVDAVCCHNGLFDHGITAKHFCGKRFFLLDTMSMAQGALASRFPRLSLSLASLAKHYFPDDPSMWKEEGGLDPSKGLWKLPPHVEQRLAGYAKQDNKVMRGIFQKLLAEDYPWHTELHNISITLAMGVYPQIHMDNLKAAAIHAEEVRIKEAVCAKLGVDRATLRSAKKFATVLESLGVEVPMKESPRTGKMTYAFAAKDPGMVELLEHDDPEIAGLAAARVGEKAAQMESRAATFARLPSPCPVPMQYASAHTGRPGGREFNMLNLKRGSPLRGCIKVPKGKKLLVSDLSQIELRMVAWWVGEQDLLDQLRSGVDPYCVLGTEIFGRTITKADEIERFIAKQAKLSCQYQVGKVKLTATVRQNKEARAFMTDEIGARTVKVYRATSPATVKMWGWLQNVAIPAMAGLGGPVEHKGVRFEHVEGIGGRARLPSGRSLWYPDLQVNEHGDWVFVFREKGRKVGWKKLYGGALLENLSQAMSADVFMFQARILDSEGLPMAMAVYDEKGFVVDEARALYWKQRTAGVQSMTPEWCKDLPCKGEGNVADNYQEAK